VRLQIIEAGLPQVQASRYRQDPRLQGQDPNVGVLCNVSWPDWVRVRVRVRVRARVIMRIRSRDLWVWELCGKIQYPE